MHKILGYSILAGVLMILFSCFSDHPKNYQAKTPLLKINEYFNGPVEAWGLLKDWRGRVTRRFKVTMVGTWKGEKGLLEEKFYFDDGEKQERTWQVTLKNDQEFTAEAQDSVGEALGVQQGNALQMRYTLRIPYKNSTLDLTLDDWMYLVDEKHLINVSTMKKWGLPVGKIVIGFTKS